MLYFAYGSNMNRKVMRQHAPFAKAMGPARIEGWRFVIGIDGYASIVAAPGAIVHGVLWRLSSHDLPGLDAYEAVDRGLYRRRSVTVQQGKRQMHALVYVAQRGGTGRPQRDYLEQVLAGARDAGLDEDYIRELARWAEPGGVPSSGMKV